MLKSLIYLQLKIWCSFLISQSDKRGIIITVSNQAANIVGKLSKCAIAMLHQAEYSVIRQEGERGYTTNALTLRLEPETGLTWQGVKLDLENCGYRVQVKS